MRSILEIDVDDAAFQRFSALFTKYRDAVDKLPRAWGSVNQATAAGVNHFADMAASMMAQAELLRKSTTEAEHLNRAISSTGRGMGALARDTRDVARNISAATISLLKWTGITGALGGLLGAGGLFGIERLAQSASGLRRSSQGLGVTSAEQQAFGINFGRIVDPRGFLSSVNEALNDVTKRSSLYGAGLNENQLRGRDAAQVATELLPQLKRIVDQTPQGMLQQTLQARGLNQFISLEEAQRLRRTPSSELQGFTRGYNRDVKDLSLTDDQLRKWQDFNVQLDRAGTNIKNIFIDGLTGLAEPLGHLSTAFSDAVKVFLGSAELKHWINDLSDGIETFAKYITTKEFKDDVKHFTEGVGDLARGLREMLKAVYDFTGGVKNAWSHVPGGPGYVPVTPEDVTKQPFSIWNPGSWLPGHHDPATGPSWLRGATGAGGGGPMVTGNAAQNAAEISATLKARGWTDSAIKGALANGIVESGLAAWGKPGAAGERGIWQFNPGSHLHPYEAFAAGKGKPVSDIATQTEYMANWVEKHIPGYKSAVDPKVATDWFMRNFEAPANPVPGSRFGALSRIPATTGAGVGTGATRSDVPNGSVVDPPAWRAAAADAASSPYAAVGAPGVKVNSRGEPYSVELERMSSSRERASVKAAYAAIKSRGWRPGLSASAYEGVDVALPYDIKGKGAGMTAAVRVEVHNQTGGSAVVTGSQVAQ